MTLLQPYVDRHAILSLEKQFHLFDLVGERSWSADLEAGTVTFGEHVMGAALLGTEADGSWMWGWANPGGFPEPVVAAGRTVGDYGREHGLPPLYEPQSEGAFLDRIALIASGAAGLKATYTAPAGETRILLGLDHPSLALPEPETPRLISVLTALLESGLVRDWPAALRAYEEARGLRLAGRIEVEFDDLGRLTSLRSRLV